MSSVIDFYDAYHLEKINNEKSSKVLMHMFVMLKPNTTLDILHKSLNDAGYSSKRLLTKEMIPTLNKIEKDNKSQEFNEILKKNYIDYLKVQPDATKYRGWFLRVGRL